MAAPEQEVVTLDKLYVHSIENGLLTRVPVRVPVPAPCGQENAPGGFSVHKNFEAFRESARQAGRDFKKALEA